jgi:arylsulfatase A-like enzyme
MIGRDPVFALAAAALVALTPAAGADDRPNIIFIMSDDHASAAVGAYGSRINETPRLDRLAAEGVLFRNAFCTNGICAPSRAVVLTGKHSHVNGVIDNGKHFDGAQRTFPKLLRAAGYQTAMIGKWHLKSDPTGFDHWEILPGQGSYYNPDFRSAEGRRRIDGYCTDITTDLAIEWLAGRDPDRPFLLMCHHKAPHRPWMPGPDHLGLYRDERIPEPATLFDDYAGRSDASRTQEMTIAGHMFLFYDLKVPPVGRPVKEQGPERWATNVMGRMSGGQREAWNAAYAASNRAFHERSPEGDDLVSWKYQRYIKDYLRSIASVDDNLGRLLDWLDAQGLAESTLIVYTSDQGFFLGEHGWYDKRFMYEPALRMPLIVRWPGATRPGSREGRLVQNLDFAPTFLEAAGVAVPDDMQGESLLPLLRGVAADGWRRSIYYEYFELGTHAVQPHYGVRTDRYKLIHFRTLGAWELYDLERDPEEMHNLVDDPAHASLVAELKAELERLRDLYDVPETPEEQENAT